MRILILTLIASLFVLACPAFSSEEDFLEWQSVVIRSKEITGVGVVVIEIETDGRDFLNLTVSAFNRQFSLDQSDLDKLSGFAVCSIRTKHEAGYEEVGGHTIYLCFKRTNFSGIDRPVIEEIRISITRDGTVVVNQPSR